jgi:hypothetical protein
MTRTLVIHWSSFVLMRPNPTRVLQRFCPFSLLALLLLGAALVPPRSAHAQSASPSASSDTRRVGWQANLRGTVGVPQGSLKDNIDGVGGGVHLYIGGWLGASPALLGLDLGILSYGRTTDTVPFSQTVGPRIPVDVTTTNNVLETHLSLRLQPRRGAARPFVEGLLGFKYLYTRTQLDDDVDDGLENDEIAGSTNFDDFAFSGGVGAGVDVLVYQPSSPTNWVQGLDLHLGVQYLLGQEAEYLAEGELEDTDGDGQLDREELDVRRSQTTLLQPQVGLTLRFFSNRPAGR